MSLKQVANLSWGERFALINHFKPADEQIQRVFGISQAELDTARSMLAAGFVCMSNQVDFNRYQGVFSGSPSATPLPEVKAPMKPVVSTVHTRPESATKKSVVRASAPPKKRGRKGDKIVNALMAVPTTPVSVDEFIQQHSVSLAVLRQSKRFIAEMDTSVAARIGIVNVRQDKATKTLMIWRS